ncbi:single-stranded DNA-binding protein [Treponema zioleckii]|uniref:single-stranded DNA-binding protein n=1 Tax=Treponema zioleckii TaxID=331680 RepID=UPI00168AC019|nr:single-stranded DNA-binding protein [Treponema zioleckii]
MACLNQVIIEGRLTRDSEGKERPWGTKYAVMSVAINEYYKDRNGNFASEVGYYDVYANGPNFCERVIKNGVKGRGVRIVGKLKQDRWKTNGKNFSKTYIVAEHVDFKAENKKADEQNQNAPLSQEAKEMENLATAAAGIRNEIEQDYDQFEIPEEEEAVF